MLSKNVPQARRGLLAALIAVVLVMASVAPALGRSSTPGGGQTGTAPVPTKPTDGPTTLPFTGPDPGLLLAVGIGVLGVGVCLRRVARPAN